MPPAEVVYPEPLKPKPCIGRRVYSLGFEAQGSVKFWWSSMKAVGEKTHGEIGVGT